MGSYGQRLLEAVTTALQRFLNDNPCDPDLGHDSRRYDGGSLPTNRHCATCTCRTVDLPKPVSEVRPYRPETPPDTNGVDRPVVNDEPIVISDEENNGPIVGMDYYLNQHIRDVYLRDRGTPRLRGDLLRDTPYRSTPSPPTPSYSPAPSNSPAPSFSPTSDHATSHDRRRHVYRFNDPPSSSEGEDDVGASGRTRSPRPHRARDPRRPYSHDGAGPSWLDD